MNSDDFYRDLQSQLNLAMAGAKTLSDEAHMHLKAAVTQAFNKLDLVTKEEFDSQQAVLMRSREKIDQLQLQLKQLEQSMQNTQ